MNEFEEAYKKLLKENTQLHAQVKFWQNQSALIQEKALKMHTSMSNLLNQTLTTIETEIKVSVKDKNARFTLLKLIGASRPLTLQSHGEDSGTQS